MRNVTKGYLEVEHTTGGIRVTDISWKLGLHFNIEELRFLQEEIELRLREVSTDLNG